jgi:prepilin-type N-terminal cleavage/methylation domain-containing protein
MVMETKARLFGRDREAGFTLVELLIVILIVGILSAVALPLYLGYTKDARLAEGKALGGSVLTALSACVQVKGTLGFCDVTEIRNRVGLGAGNSTYDGRWVVSSASLTVSSAIPPVLDGLIQVSGVSGKNTDGMALTFFADLEGVTLRCNTTSLTAPTSKTISATSESC